MGRLYTVGRRALFLHRCGEGRPAVVFVAGAGTVGLDYLNVQLRAARIATSVVYDRSGTGWSGGAPVNRSSARVTNELLALLRAAEIPPPYVLVGHSFGGLIARLFAQRFADEVAGLVLIDPAHEDYDAYMPAELNTLRRVGTANASPFRAWIGRAVARASLAGLGLLVRYAPLLLIWVPPVPRYRRLYRRLFTAEMAEWPPAIRDELVERHVSLKWLLAGMQEAQTVERLYREARAGGPLPDVPTIILSSNGIDDFRRAVSAGQSEALIEAELAAKRRLYEDVAALLPRAEVRDVPAGHLTIHFRQPEAVIDAIADVLSATPNRDQSLTA